MTGGKQDMRALYLELEPQLGLGSARSSWQALSASRSFWIWLGLASYWMLRGLSLRFQDASIGLPEMLNEAGMTLWIAGALMAPGLEQLLRRSHQNHSGGGRLGAVATMQGLAYSLPWVSSTAFMLALACLPSLLPYTPGSELMLAATAEPFEFPLILLPFVLFCLFLGGGVAVLLSCGLHALLRRWLGNSIAFVIWFGAFLLIHWHSLSGADLLLRGNDGELSWIDHVPLSLGQQVVELISTLRATGASPPYLSDIVTVLSAVFLGQLAASLLLLTLSSVGLRQGYWPSRLFPLLVAAGILSPVAVLAPGLIRWLDQPDVPAPGDWQSLGMVGLSAIWLTAWLARWPFGLDARSQPSGLAWWLFHLTLPLYWVLLSTPAISAGQASQMEVLYQCAATFSLLAAGMALITLSDRLSRAWPGWLQAILKLATLAILLLPFVDGKASLPILLLQTLPQSLGQSDTQALALLILGLLLAFAVLAPLLGPRPQRQAGQSRQMKARGSAA